MQPSHGPGWRGPGQNFAKDLREVRSSSAIIQQLAVEQTVGLNGLKDRCPSGICGDKQS